MFRLGEPAEISNIEKHNNYKETRKAGIVEK